MLLAGIIMIIVIITAGVNIVKNNRKKAEQAAVTKAKQEKLAKQEQEELEKENTLSMIAVGDNLYHDAILEEGKTDSGDWNFDFLYQNVKKEIEEADLSAVNQETVFVNNHDEVAGYPEFASPLEGGDALIKAGFNIVPQASNHAYDKGKAGILNSVTFWRTSHPNVTLLGIHKDQQDEERNRIQVVEKKNFKIAMMNYTFGLNEATPLPEDESYSIDVFDEEQVANDIETAKSESEVVIDFLHTGVEDTTDIDEDTENRIDFLARYLQQVKRAASEMDLRGYFEWTLLDNFEWNKGYAERFGLVYVDYRNQQRILKDSAYWYKHVIKTNGEEI